MWEAYKTGATGYVAIGISKDDHMGDDLVMACQDVSEQSDSIVMSAKRYPLIRNKLTNLE